MKRIEEGGLAAQFDELGLRNIMDWEHMSANVLFENPAIRPGHLIIHFDLYTQFHQLNQQLHLKTLLEQYDETYALTLCTHYKILRSRVADRLVQLFQKPSALLKKRKILKQLRKRSRKLIFYSRLKNVVGLYAQLSEIISAHPNVRACWMMDTSEWDNEIILQLNPAQFQDLLAHGKSPGPCANLTPDSTA